MRTLRELRTLDRAAFSYLSIRNQDHLHHYDDDKVMIMLKVKWLSFWSSRLTSGNDSLLWALAWRAKQPDGYKDDEEDDYNVEKNNHDDGNIEILNWFQFPTKETGKKREKNSQEKSSLRKSSSYRIDKKSIYQNYLRPPKLSPPSTPPSPHAGSCRGKLLLLQKVKSFHGHNHHHHHLSHNLNCHPEVPARRSLRLLPLPNHCR